MIWDGRDLPACRAMGGRWWKCLTRQDRSVIKTTVLPYDHYKLDYDQELGGS